MTSKSSSSNASDQAITLAECAHGRLLGVLMERNAVSQGHFRATQQMLSGMAAQAVGIDPGRYAYGLPCGGGKTQGVVALIAAAHELGLGLTFAVATSQIEALCSIKRDLLHAGVPAEDIGLMHWYKWRQEREHCGPGTGYASEPATPENREYPILLLSHAKIQHGHTATYQGQPRNLLIWDESLLSTKASTVAVKEIRRAMELCKLDTPDLVPFIQKVLGPVEAELARLVSDEQELPKPLSNLLTLPEMDEARQLAHRIGRGGRFEAATHDTVMNMLALVEQPVSVATTGNGGNGEGFLRYEVKVADHLKNIAILDASHVIRDLTQADATIKDRTSEDMLNYKSYSAVRVQQVKLPTGKTTLTKNPEASISVAQEVQRAIEAVPADECVLIFTFKDAKRAMEKNLEKIGVDLTERIAVEGVLRRRIELLTWGQETSRNDLLHCKHVIMAGVLRRDPLDLSAALTGQQRSGDSPQRHSVETLRRLNLSEMAHCVLQGMNRGCCRVMDADGRAKAMTLTILVTGADDLYEVLTPVLPGIQWECSTPVGKPQSKTTQAAIRIKDYLRDLAKSEVSVSALRKVLGISLGREAMQEAVNAALAMLSITEQQWRREARSLVRC